MAQGDQRDRFPAAWPIGQERLRGFGTRVHGLASHPSVALQAVTRPTVSWWLDDAHQLGLVPPPAPSLERPTAADVLVIGGGFAGLSTALAIAEGGTRRRVVW